VSFKDYSTAKKEGMDDAVELERAGRSFLPQISGHWGEFPSAFGPCLLGERCTILPCLTTHRLRKQS